MADVPACWEAHPEACWELANLMTERGRIYRDPDNQDLQGALWWFERWFPVVLARLGPAIRCDATDCRMARSSPWERGSAPLSLTVPRAPACFPCARAHHDSMSTCGTR